MHRASSVLQIFLFLISVSLEFGKCLGLPIRHRLWPGYDASKIWISVARTFGRVSTSLFGSFLPCHPILLSLDRSAFFLALLVRRSSSLGDKPSRLKCST